MPTIVDRDLVVALLHEEFGEIGALAREFDTGTWATPTCLPGWTVQDVVSHIAGTEAMLLGEPAPEVDVAHLPHLRNDIARAGEVWVEAMRAASGPEVLARFTDVVARRLALLDAMSQADFDARSWTPAGPDETYGRFMRIRHYDCFMHEHDIRAALGLPERADPRHVASALEEPIASLGYIVGKRAKVPSGHRVEITVTGAVERTLRVDVAERATVVEHFADGPTVAITLPATLFLRLTGGREPGEPHLGHAITLGGDTALATQLATHLAYTI